VAGDDAATVLALGDPLLEVEARARDWLVKDLLRVEGTKTVSSSRGWTVTRNTEGMDWKLLGSSQAPDLQKATDLASSLGWVNLVDVGCRSCEGRHRARPSGDLRHRPSTA